MTTAIKLVLAQAFGIGRDVLGAPIDAHRVLHRRPFAERGPSTRVHLGSQLRWNCSSSRMPRLRLSVGGFCALGSQGTCVTRHSRKLDLLAWDHRDGLATRTGHLHTRKVQGEPCFVKSGLTCGQGRAIMYTPCPPLLGNAGSPCIPGRYRVAAGVRGFLQLPRPTALLPHAPAHSPGGPPPPG